MVFDLPFPWCGQLHWSGLGRRESRWLAVSNKDVRHSKDAVHLSTDKKDVRLTRYDEETIKSYFKYLKGERGRLHTEHGIIAGYKLFDSLYRNFCRVTEGKQFVAGVYTEKETGLHWRKSHLDHFAYISDAIICHNLWTVTDGNNSRDKKEVKK